MAEAILAVIFLLALLYRERARDERTLQIVTRLLENHNEAREAWDRERTNLLNRIESPGTIQLPYAALSENELTPEEPEPDEYDMVGVIENGKPDAG